MSFLCAKPSELLSPYISQYWIIENCIPKGKSHIQRIVPSGLMELSFYLGDRPKVLNSKSELPENTLLSGQRNTHYDLLISGKLSIFSVTFKPQGVRMFFNLPLIELFNQNIPLCFIEKEAVQKVENDLLQSLNFGDKIKATEEYLLRQLQKNGYDQNERRIKDSIRIINQSKGVISVEELASRACLSEKQYSRIIKDYVGISPKQFLRIIRFQHAIYKKQNKPNISLTNLAYDCGYFDQSHMISDFKDLSGKAPKQFFSDCEKPYSDYFSGD